MSLDYILPMTPATTDPVCIPMVISNLRFFFFDKLSSFRIERIYFMSHKMRRKIKTGISRANFAITMDIKSSANFAAVSQLTLTSIDSGNPQATKYPGDRV